MSKISIVASTLLLLTVSAVADEAKDPRYQTITQTELQQKIRTTPIESPEHERLLARANFAGLRKFAYDQYQALWRQQQGNAFANLYLGMAALDNWSAVNTPTITREQASWLQTGETCLRTAIKLDPESPEIQMEYGYYCWKYTNDSSLGIKMLKSAATKKPSDARVHRLLGAVYANPGSALFNQNRADSELHTAIKLDPLYAGPHGELYHFYYNVKRYEDAEREVQLFKALIPKQLAESKGMTSYEEMILSAIAKKQ